MKKLLSKIVYINGVFCIGTGLFYISAHYNTWMIWLACIALIFGASLMIITSNTWEET